MKRIVIFILCITAVVFGDRLPAQSDLLFSNSMRTAAIYNPALIENNGFINLQLLSRQQWIGFPDAPSAYQLSGDYFFGSHNMGLKANIISQTTGKEVTRRFVIDYIYRVYFTDDIFINFGLGAGIYQRNILYSKLVYYEGNEPLIRPDESYIRPDFEFGLQLTAGIFDIGYAVNHLGEINRDPSISRTPLHHHVYGTYLLTLQDEYKLRAGMSYHQQGKVNYLQLDAQAFLGVLQAGIGWRHLDAFIIKAGIQATPQLEVHYSYDIGINKMANFNSGTHEVLLVLRLQKGGRTYLSPRYLDY